MCLGQARDQFATAKSISCVNETKDDCKKHKCQLKMMDDEQNLWKNTVKGTQTKTSKKKKMLANHRHKLEKCIKIHQYIVIVQRLLKCPTVTSNEVTFSTVTFSMQKQVSEELYRSSHQTCSLKLQQQIICKE